MEELNDLELLLPEDLAYIAGFFDGEGYIGIVKNQGLRLWVQINNTKPELLYWLKDLFGGSMFKSDRFPKCKPIHSWTVVSRDAAAFLYKIQPYLRLKDELAELGLEFQRTKEWGKNNGKNPPTEETLQYRDFIRDRVMELNKRGVKETSHGG